MSKKALITGITGQDGSYLAELLLSKEYDVHGIVRRSSSINTDRIDHIYQDPHDPRAKLFLHYGDLSDGEQVSNIVHDVSPDEIYNLGAQSHVRVSFDMPENTSNVTGIGTLRILEAIRRSGKNIRLYQASSSEMFGRSQAPQNELTPFRPVSPYGVAKLSSYWNTVNYREGHGILASNGILFNHESPRRGETFVTRKITRAIANIIAGNQERLYLGNLDAKRDWGFAPEYVEAMHLILQQDTPSDYVLGTGKTHSVDNFLDFAFKYAKLPKEIVNFDSKYLRPVEVNVLQADSTNARSILEWQPKITLEELAKIMVDADMRALKKKDKDSPEPIGEGDAILAEKFPNRWWKVD